MATTATFNQFAFEMALVTQLTALLRQGRRGRVTVEAHMGRAKRVLVGHGYREAVAFGIVRDCRDMAYLAAEVE